MLPLKEIAGAALEAGKAITEINSVAQVSTEYPDLFRRCNKIEGLKNIESQPSARVAYPRLFEKSETNKIQYDDSGKPYRIENKLLPDNEYTINGYHYNTDEIGRISSVEGQLHLKQHDGRLLIKDSIEDIGKGYQNQGDDRGHLIGDQFGGKNGLENMIPQNAEVNRVEFKNFENQLAKELKTGNSVYVKIDPVYETNSYRPDRIAVNYNIDGKQNFRFFENK